ncbi:hypothetical protein K435DRAFT_610920, partial [Dendrothele bispora CBS 962.96]
CNECLSNLSKGKIPPFALANMYRGELPEFLCNLQPPITWAEEMACALFHTTAHVVRLYGSADESQPRVLHGNTCAHELNVVSTAKKLPWTPTDINGMISIIFVGPKKLTVDELKKPQQFYVRRDVIQKILYYLFNNNELYMSLPCPPDHNILSLYPENGILPGLPDQIVYDHE